MYKYKWCFMTRIIFKTHPLQNMPAEKKYFFSEWRKRLSIVNIRPKRWMLFRVYEADAREWKKENRGRKMCGHFKFNGVCLESKLNIFMSKEILENWYFYFVCNHYWWWIFWKEDIYPKISYVNFEYNESFIHIFVWNICFPIQIDSIWL